MCGIGAPVRSAPGPGRRFILPNSCCHAGYRDAKVARRSGAPPASPPPPAPIRKDRPRRIVAGRAGDPAARMSTCAAMVEAGHRTAIVGMAEQRAGPEQLIERERAMKNVAAD